MKIITFLLSFVIIFLVLISCEFSDNHRKNKEGVMSKDEIKKEIKALEKHLESFPYDGDAHIQLALFYTDEEPNDKALEHYHKAIELQPQNPSFRMYLGLFYFRNLKDYNLSINELQKAIELDDKEFKAYETLGKIYALKGEKETAKKYYKKALDVLPEYVNRYYQRTKYQLDIKTAREQINKALKDLD